MTIASIPADPHDVLIRPVVSEKSFALAEQKTYSFVVHPEANKTQVKLAVEKVFGVKVARVNIMNRNGKRKRTRFGLGKRADTKRALVSLTESSKTIDIFTTAGA
jgi:large subunit ribosomal protein L23